MTTAALPATTAVLPATTAALSAMTAALPATTAAPPAMTTGGGVDTLDFRPSRRKRMWPPSGDLYSLGDSAARRATADRC